MALTTAAEVYRLVQTMRYASAITVQNVFHFGLAVAGGTSGALVNDWNTNVIPYWKAHIWSGISFVEVNAQMIAPTEQDVSRIPLTGVGTSSFTIGAPAPTAAVWTWRTQLTGRSRRGRTYLAGWGYDNSSWSNGYVWTANSITQLGAFADTIRLRYQLGGNPSGFYLGVWSPKLGGKNLPRDPAAGLAMVTGVTVQPYVATMGTRRYGRGV